MSHRVGQSELGTEFDVLALCWCCVGTVLRRCALMALAALAALAFVDVLATPLATRLASYLAAPHLFLFTLPVFGWEMVRQFHSMFHVCCVCLFLYLYEMYVLSFSSITKPKARL